MVKINAKHQHAGIFSMSTENHHLVPKVALENEG